MRYLWSAIFSILESYRGGNPLAIFLKDFFRRNPKLGSRDRRVISEAVYCWYRASKALPDELSPEKKLQASLLLCGTLVKARMLLPGDWQSIADENFSARIQFLKGEGISFRSDQLFPHAIDFSSGISAEAWKFSLLSQPRLFLRLRSPLAEVEPLLERAGIAFARHDAYCLSLPNGTDIKDILPSDAYVVQDLSSQRTGAYFRAAQNQSWWDVCAGAGGKSILLKDLEPTVQLTATDIRSSILQNLVARFHRYHLKPPQVHVLDAGDAQKAAQLLGNRRFDGILCDVPCTGSGTWGRTPEGAYFFDPANLLHYAGRQHRILTNAAHYLKPGGRIVYATCSVFREENEAIVERITSDMRLRIESATLLSGLAYEADSLFVSVLRAG